MKDKAPAGGRSGRPSSATAVSPLRDGPSCGVPDRGCDVLVISQHYWPESFRINDVVDSLRAEGCRVTVLAGQPNYPEGRVYPGYKASGAGIERHPHGYDIVRVPVVVRGSGGALRLALNYLSFATNSTLLGPFLLRKRRFDVIFVYGISPILQALAGTLLRRVKHAALILWVQDLWPQSVEATGYVRNKLALSLIGRLTSWLYGRCDRLLVQSPAFAEPVRELAGDRAVIAYHPNPGEFVTDPDPDACPALQLEPGFNVVFAGNLGSAQALETVLAAAELLRDQDEIRIVLVGSGSRSGWLRQEVERRALGNVRLAGRFAPEAIPGIVAQASALLLTLARSDTLARTIPSKLPSYLAASKAVIVAADGESARLVGEAEAGLAVPAEDPPALAAAIMELARMTAEERWEMGSRGRRYYERHFSPERLTGELLRHFNEAGADRRAGRTGAGRAR